MENPIEFYLDEDDNLDFGDKNIFINEENVTGDVFKVTVRIICNSHDGCCTDFNIDLGSSPLRERTKEEQEEMTETEIKTISFYIKATEELKAHVDSENFLIENDETEKFFVEWDSMSSDCGCGCCGLRNYYTPVKYEYIRFST